MHPDSIHEFVGLLAHPLGPLILRPFIWVVSLSLCGPLSKALQDKLTGDATDFRDCDPL
jgi:hypothetical protein